MVIQRFDASQFYKSYVPAPKSGESKPADSKAGADKLDRLELSSSIPQMRQAALAASISAEVHEDTPAEKLSAIKQKIADGTYEVPASVIAAAILGGTKSI